jgi:tetratricopeptide (TPR) repeat protein
MLSMTIPYHPFMRYQQGLIPSCNKSLGELQKLVNYFPHNGEISSQLGDAYLKEGLYKSAWYAYQTAINLDYHKIDLQINQAMIYRLEGRYAQAFELLLQLIKSSENSDATKAEAFCELAILYRLGITKSIDESAWALEQAIQLNPHEANYYHLLADLHLRTPDKIDFPRQAIHKVCEWLHQAISLDKYQPAYQLNNAYALFIDKQYDAALDQCAIVLKLELSPYFSMAAYMLSAWALVDICIEYSDTVTEDDYCDILTNLQQVDSMLEADPDRETELIIFLADFLNSTEFTRKDIYCLQADVYLKLNRLPQALQALRAGLNLMPNDEELLKTYLNVKVRSRSALRSHSLFAAPLECNEPEYPLALLFQP